MINLSKKLYISLFTLVLLIVVAGTATFAWFKMNTNAWFDGMELEMSSANGVKISVDGEHYFYNLSKTEMEYGIIAKATDWKIGYYNVDTVERKPYMYTLTNKGEEKIVDEDDVESAWNHIKLGSVTSYDGEHFYSINERIRKSKELNVSQGQYVNLDIYFETDNGMDRDVYFSNENISYEDGTYIPKTEFSVKYEDSITIPTNRDCDVVYYDLENGELKTLAKGAEPDDGLRFLASDALRFSRSVYENGKQTKKYEIFEPNMGRGSYATNLSEKYYVGAAGAAYDSTKNAAFNYYNWVSVNINQSTEIDDIAYSTVPKTYKGFDTIEAAKIVSLNDSNNHGYNGSVKMNMSIWMEGEDADCIDLVWEQVLSVQLSFTGYSIQNDTVTLTYRTTNPETGETVAERKVHQIVGLEISDQQPVVDTYSSNCASEPYKFKGWGLLNEETQEVTEYDFSQPVKPLVDTGEEIKWTLVSMWQK